MITFSKNSWHYWLATRFTDDMSDIKTACQYISRIFGVVVLSVYLLFSAIGSAFLVLSGPAYYFIHALGYKISDYGFEEISLAVDVVVPIIALATYIIVKYKSRHKKPTSIQPSLLKTIYQSFKDKMCVMVDFE